MDVVCYGVVYQKNGKTEVEVGTVYDHEACIQQRFREIKERAGVTEFVKALVGDSSVWQTIASYTKS